MITQTTSLSGSGGITQQQSPTQNNNEIRQLSSLDITIVNGTSFAKKHQASNTDVLNSKYRIEYSDGRYLEGEFKDGNLDSGIIIDEKGLNGILNTLITLSLKFSLQK